jgi:beta-ribofuranosylaminobenzene 5'-phosphate synthase
MIGLEVEAPARIHFGMLDLGGTRGRRFGGIGAAIQPPSVRLTAEPADDVVVSVDAALDDSTDLAEAQRVIATAVKRVLADNTIDRGLHVTVHRLLPAHHGLGSGTQLALAAATATARAYGLPDDPVHLSQVVGRAQRSAVGTYAFAHGGFIVEGGRRPDATAPAPLVARLPMPNLWRCVLAVPPGEPGVSGSAERSAFASLPAPPAQDAERIAHVVLMQLLPALAESDFGAFGAALTEIQAINGRWFAPVQGGPYAPGPSATIVQALTSWRATGVGQSSWGPAVYAIASDPEKSAALVRRLRTTFPEAAVYDALFWNGPSNSF